MADGSPPRGDASLFAPGYSGGQAQARAPVPADSGWYGPSGAAGKDPVHGFPPAPGQPPPVYQSGQFSAWNRASGQDGNGYDPSVSDAWLAVDYAGPAGDGYPEPGDAEAGPVDAGFGETGYAGPGYPGRGPAEPGYAPPAVGQPAADVTPAQAWRTADTAAPASHWPGLSATDEQWPDLGEATPFSRAGDTDAGQDGMPAGAALAAGLAGPILAEPGVAGPGLAGPALAGPGEGHPDGWDDPPWPGADPGPADRAATGPNPRTAEPGAGRAPGGRGRGTRGRAQPRGRKRPVRTLLACALALAVVVGVTYFWFARDHKSPNAAAVSQQTAATTRPSPTDPSPSPSPSLGPWGHIGSRALDPVPLTLAELFPAQFTGGSTSYVRTAEKAKTHCATALMGSQLVTAVSHAGCTQAMRASYLSADHKLMGTIGVLNLVTAAAAEKAGKVAGPAEFIAQLPGTKGPTRNLTKGTGFEAAEVKGHYLVLVWAEFADLRAPRSAAQRAELESFISLLFQQTANVSLASREVTGSPAA